MKDNTQVLISRLMQTCEQHLQMLAALETNSDEALNRRAHNQAWSALECIEHLNLYGQYYLPIMAARMDAFKKQYPSFTPETTFSSGILGNYFAQSMLPKAKLNKMKTFRDKNPIHSALNRQVLQRYKEQLNTLLQLLESSKQTGLMQVRIPISIAKWLRLNLGDTFRFIIHHNYRHLLQAEKAIAGETVL